METIVQDVRYSIRLLLKQRGFAAVAIVTLAIGIGAVTAVVSVIDAAMLRPLPYPDPATFAAVALVLGIAGCIAAWIPARRAVRIDPVTALRVD